MDAFTTKVAARAASITPVKVLLAILVAPFWLLGAVLSVLWVLLTWAYAAGAVGFGDVQRRAGREPAGDT